MTANKLSKPTLFSESISISTWYRYWKGGLWIPTQRTIKNPFWLSLFEPHNIPGNIKLHADNWLVDRQQWYTVLQQSGLPTDSKLICITPVISLTPNVMEQPKLLSDSKWIGSPPWAACLLSAVYLRVAFTCAIFLHQLPLEGQKWAVIKFALFQQMKAEDAIKTILSK